MLRSGQKVIIPVKGFSMLPFIRGELDLVELEAAKEYVPEDIVLFTVGGRYVMHRLLSIKDGIAEIMGDGVSRGKEHCPVEDIHGRAIRILRGAAGREGRPRREVDPRSRGEIRKARMWRKFLPVRRYLLIAYRLLPWNWKINRKTI